MLAETQLTPSEAHRIDHTYHSQDDRCMKLCIGAFQMQFEVDPNSDEDIHWEAVFFLKNLKGLKQEDIPETIACAAKSIFSILYTKTDCVGNQAISLRLTVGDKNDIDSKLTELFTLSLMDEIQEDSIFLDDRSISHSYTYLSKDLSQGALHFTFNNPPAEQLKKIIIQLSNIFPNTETSVSEDYCTHL